MYLSLKITTQTSQFAILSFFKYPSHSSTYMYKDCCYRRFFRSSMMNLSLLPGYNFDFAALIKELKLRKNKINVHIDGKLCQKIITSCSKKHTICNFYWSFQLCFFFFMSIENTYTETPQAFKLPLPTHPIFLKRSGST